MIKWLVAGAGQAGRCHMAAIRQSANATLAGVADPVLPPETDAPFFPDLAMALEEVDANAVVVATPNDAQLDCVATALKAGLPVLCEKPVGRSVEEARQVLTLSKDLNVPVGVVLNQRAQVHNRWIKDLIQERTLVPQTIEFTGNLPRLTGWHADPARAGGGALRTIGNHYIDLLMWWLGPLKRVSVSLSGEPVEDTFSVSADLGDGCRAEIRVEAISDAGQGPVQCKIEGEGSSIHLSGYEIVNIEGLPDPPPVERAAAEFIFGPGHLAVIADATDSLHQGRPFPVSLDEALPLLETIQDMYE